jgi:glycerate kinase
MKIVIAPDSFKGSLTSLEAANIIARTIHARHPDATIVSIPIADGGDGTVEALAQVNKESRRVRYDFTGPLGHVAHPEALILAPDYKTWVIDMASVSGLLLVPPEQRNPMITTTCGTGELIRAASISGELIIGLGGSATNDCGLGCLIALGFKLLDANGKALRESARPKDLARVVRIDDSSVPSAVMSANVTLACDVDNPLTGERGASRVFGPQKGATPEIVDELEELLAYFGQVLDQYALSRPGGGPVSPRAGSGAAGGLGAALMAIWPSAKVRPGIEIFLDYGGFDEAVAGADLVITGEGRLDSQTLGGKAILGILQRSQKAHVDVAIIAGSVDSGADAEMAKLGASVVELKSLAGSSEAAIADAERYLEAATVEVLRTLSV